MVTMSSVPGGHPFIARDKGGEIWTCRQDESKVCPAITVEAKVLGLLREWWDRALYNLMK